MRLGITPGAYLIHGTNNPIAVGMAITHGCIRMYPEDIEALFPLVPVGTPVWLVNEPVKVARVDGQVLARSASAGRRRGPARRGGSGRFYALANAALGETPAAIHWDFVLATLKDASGLPQTRSVWRWTADVVPPRRRRADPAIARGTPAPPVGAEPAAPRYRCAVS